MRQLQRARGFASAAEAPLKATLVPGDGVGPEIADAVTLVLKTAGVPVQWEVQVVKHDKPDPRTNSFVSRENLDSVKVRPRPQAVESVAQCCCTPARADACHAWLLQRNGIGLKGPMMTPVGKGFRSLNLTLRKELDLFANVRPCMSIPGYPTPYDQVDLVTIRENTEGEYSGLEHAVVPGVAESLKVGRRGQVVCACRRADTQGPTRTGHHTPSQPACGGVRVQGARDSVTALPPAPLDAPACVSVR